MIGRALIVVFLCALSANVARSKDLPPELGARLEEIFDKRIYEAARPPNVRWLDGGARYAYLKTPADGPPELLRCDSATGACELWVSFKHLKDSIQTVDPSVQTITGYLLSSDGARLFVGGTRRSHGDVTSDDLWVFERATDSAKKLATDVEQSRENSLSPDGTRLAFVREQNLFVVDVRMTKTTQLTREPRRKTDDGDPPITFEVAWSPDGERLAFIRTDESNVGQYPLIDNTAAVYPKVRMQRYSKVGTPLADQRVGVASARGGATTWVKLPGAPGSYFVGPMWWTQDSTELLIKKLTRASNERDIFRADVKTGRTTLVEVERDDAWVQNEFPPDHGFDWIKRGAAFTWLSERDGWRRAYAVSSTGALALTPEGVDVIASARADDARGWLYYFASPDNATQRYLYRAALDGSLRAERITPADQPGTHFYNISPDARWAAHTYSTADSPPVVQLIELPTHRTVRLLEDNIELRQRLAAWAPRPTEFLQLAIGEGVTMDAWMLKPRDFDPRQKYPVFVFVYGEPASQTVLDAWAHTRTLFHRAIADAGYLVVTMDNRGTPAPKGAKWRRAVFGSLGPLSTEEQAAGLRELARTRPYVDPSRVGIWGWSAGGTNTLNALFRKPDQYQVGIAVAPKPRPDLYHSAFQETYMRTPAQNPDGFRRAAPINYAEGLRGDLLIIHGTLDDNTHLQGVEHLVNRLIELGKPFDYMTYPGRTHAIREGPGTTPHLYKLIARYLVEHLPPGGREQRHSAR
ncbi:MAG: DPP IV N-terminal domain-containing protein [Micropepsaceae bacterium]